MTIEGYWQWWASARDSVVDAVDNSRTDDPAIGELLDRIAELGLACEMGPGVQARHALSVSANGDPALRKLAYRWYDAAPVDDAFEFHPARIAAPSAADTVLMLGDDEFAFSDFRFDVSVDEERMELDLVVAHPAFPLLDDETRGQVGFLGLDNILGEEEVERWIGGLEWSERPPVGGGVGASELRAQVEQLATTAPSGEWAILRGEDAIVIAARPLRPVDHPYFDELCQLTAVVDELSVLQDHEEELTSHFGRRAFHAASLTRGGERTAFVYVDREESTSTELGAWASARGYGFQCSHDPGWDAVRTFR